MKTPTATHFAIVSALALVGIGAVWGSVNATMPTHRTEPATVGLVLGASTTNAVLRLSAERPTYHPADASTGMRRATIKIAVQNDSTTGFSFSPGLHLTAVATNGAIYTPTARYMPADSTSGGEIASRASTQLSVDFDIARDATIMSLSLQPDAQTKPITVEL